MLLISLLFFYLYQNKKTMYKTKYTCKCGIEDIQYNEEYQYNEEFQEDDDTQTKKQKKINPIKNNGFDQRYNETNNIFFRDNNKDRKIIYDFIINYNKKKMLELLTNKDISIFTKLDLLQDNRDKITSPNIKSGGLYKDYDFEM